MYGACKKINIYIKSSKLNEIHGMLRRVAGDLNRNNIVFIADKKEETSV